MNQTSHTFKSSLSALGAVLFFAPIITSCGQANHNNTPIPAITNQSSNNGIVGKTNNVSPSTNSSSGTTSTNSSATSTPEVKTLKKYHIDSTYAPPKSSSISSSANTNNDNTTNSKSTNNNNNNNKTSTNSNNTNTTNDNNSGIIQDGTDGNGGRVGVTKSGKIYSPSDAKNSYTAKSTTDKALGYPVNISVPKMGLYHSIMSYGLRDGILDPYPNSVQYYTGSVKPGQIGNSVIASHVTYNGYPKSFYYLNQLSKGDKFTITYSNGAKKTFQVYNKESVNKYTLKYDQRVWGSSTTANVVLLSCDKNSGWMPGHMHRTNNFVVWAKLV